MIQDKFLPIGTVVLLKGGSKRLMISGFLPISDDKKHFDYSGCLYPEGFLSSDQVCLFNHEQIEKVYNMGYQDEESKEFMVNLKKVEDNLSQNN